MFCMTILQDSKINAIQSLIETYPFSNFEEKGFFEKIVSPENRSYLNQITLLSDPPVHSPTAIYALFYPKNSNGRFIYAHAGYGFKKVFEILRTLRSGGHVSIYVSFEGLPHNLEYYKATETNRLVDTSKPSSLTSVDKFTYAFYTNHLGFTLLESKLLSMIDDALDSGDKTSFIDCQKFLVKLKESFYALDVFTDVSTSNFNSLDEFVESSTYSTALNVFLSNVSIFEVERELATSNFLLKELNNILNEMNK